VALEKPVLKPPNKNPRGPRDFFFGRNRRADRAGLRVRALKAEMITDIAMAVSYTHLTLPTICSV